MINRNQKGFTIIELMIASSVFAIVLILISMGLIQVGRLFYKGISITNTQEVARIVTDDISDAIRFSGQSVTTPIAVGTDGLSQGFCAGNKRYSYILDRQLVDASPGAGQSLHVLVVDEVNSCNGSTQAQSVTGSGALTTTSRELMGLRMRLAGLSLQPVILPDRSDIYTLTIRIVFGDADLLVSGNQNCRTDTAGSQFCSAAELSTTIQKRIE